MLITLNRLFMALATTVAATVTLGAVEPSQSTLTLSECRDMALQNNKQMAISAEKVRAAGYTRKEAFAAYLPAIDFAGSYAYNQKKISVFDSDQLLPTKSFDPKTGQYEFNLVTNPETGMPVKGPDGQYIPSTVALIPKKAMEYDIHNLFFGAVTLTQPIYMGGKIVALNRMAKLGEEVERNLRSSEAENTIYAVDAAYWTVVSLMAKQKLAVSYVALLDSLQNNVQAMLREGVATRSDLLSVDVKANQARIDLVKVDNGLHLSRMALAQLCGLPLDGEYVPADTAVVRESLPSTEAEIATSYDMNLIYARRHDLAALRLGVKVAEQQARVAMSSMLPNVVLIGGYSFSNPNMYNGFSRHFNGAFSVGVGVTIPLIHWGGNYNKYRAARSASTIMKLTLADAEEKVELQVRQAAYKATEALKTFDMTCVNLDKANENLRSATLGFHEGVLTSDDVMAAQTAWLQANSEKIDAAIDVRLCDVYLSKVLGQMEVK